MNDRDDDDDEDDDDDDVDDDDDADNADDDDTGIFTGTPWKHEKDECLGRGLDFTRKLE